MRRIFPFFLLVLISFVSSAQTGRDLFFSEYVEGTQNNKALEIFNPNNAVVDLAAYRIVFAIDGANWSVWKTFPTGKTLAPDSVWTLVNDQFTIPTFDLALADEKFFSNEINFGGNDAIGLMKISATDTSLIDVIGVPDAGNPGSGWDVAGILSATANHTLIRKSSIEKGSLNWDLSRGSTGSNSEWIVKNTDFADSLGHHFFRPVVFITDIIISTSVSTTIDVDHGQIQLSAEALPTSATDKKLIWSSSEPFALSVNQDGLVLALNNGTAWISAWTTDGSGVADSIKISAINQSGTLLVSSISINGLNGQDTIKINKGTILMTADIKPINATNKGITWSVDQPLLADIGTDGILTAKKNGKVLVTATANDGSGVSGSKTIIIFGQYSEVANLTALRAAYTANETIFRISGEVILSHWVYNRSTKYVQDDNAGIVIEDPFGKITSTYKVGDGVTGLIGYLLDDYGMLQFHPIEDPGAITAENKVLTPLILTVKEFNANFEKYESRLIKIDKLEFDQAGGIFQYLNNYTLRVGNDITVLRTEFANADFLGMQIPDSANVTGIAIQLNKTPKIAPRRLDDIDILPLPKTGINQGKTPAISIYPNPVTDELHFSSSFIVNSFEITDGSGRVVLSGKTGKTENYISVGNLSRGLYFIRFYGTYGTIQSKFIKH